MRDHAVNRVLIEVGLYGKLPCRGDFLQRRAPQDFVDIWDPWLQECLHETRQRLQDSWLDTYLTSPVWRFVLSPGVCGEGAFAGILVPSVDRVGRYFPLTVLAQLDAEECPLAVACRSTAWFESAESLVLGALEAEALDFDTFDEQIALLRDQLDADNEASRVLQLLQTSQFPGAESVRWQVPLTSAESLQSAVNALAYREVSRSLQPLALWWTQGSTSLSPSWLSTRGLPDARSFVAMLTGDWNGADWTMVRAGGRF
jgi:type VI secretion system protein ImpM